MFDDVADSRFRLPVQPAYDHTQYAPLYLLMLAPSLVLLFVAMTLAANSEQAAALIGVSALVGLVAYSMRRLRVYDAGESLVARFGPIPIFGKRIRYERIEAFAPDRTSLVDGWGIHWVPGRGWTYNLWGYDCVRLELLGGRTVRIGTDDPEGLAAFLRQRCGDPVPEAPE